MRTLTLALATVATLLCTAPSCLPESQGGGVNWPKVAECGADVADIIAQISRVLMQDKTAPTLSDKSQDELLQIAREHGPELTACMIDKADHQMAAGSSDQVRAASVRGEAFLRSHAIEIHRIP